MGSLGLLLAWLSVPSLTAGAASPPSTAGKVDFNRDIRPILSDNCFACHGPDKDKRKGGLRLDLRDEALKKLSSGATALVPGKPSQSALIQRLTTKDADDLMPPAKSGKKLTPTQVALLRKWVEQGAKWTEHWAYNAPERPPLPKVKDARLFLDPVDRFVLARLEQAGLKPSPEAARTALIRRVTLDLTGLPPTPAEVDAFLADRAPDAYEKVVDGLLKRPAYGERMAVAWLDQARYADTSGYHNDSLRDMWPWREWVIAAFNRNLTFDQFTVEQLAGDLLPNATREQKVASGFNRNVMTNDEGGADANEYLAKYIVDRVSTTSAVWLGTTVGCAECHDHKYDPISTKEFYQLYALFHNVPEKGLDGTRTTNPAPFMPVPTSEQEAKLAELDQSIPATDATVKKLEAALPAAQTKWEAEFRANPLKVVEPSGMTLRFKLDDSLEGVDATDVPLTAAFKGSTNAPAWVGGRIGRALKFDGQAYLDAGNAVAFERTNAFSFGCWARIDGKGKGGTLLSRMDDAKEFRGVDLMVDDKFKLDSHLISDWPANGIKVSSKDALPKDVWLHLFVTYDGSSKAAGVKLYVNGKAVALDMPSDKLTSGTLAAQTGLHVGRRGNSGNFQGALDDVRCYSRALKADEVGALVTAGNLSLLATAAAARTPEQAADLKKFFREHHAKDVIAAEAEFARLKAEKDAVTKQIPTTMVMEDMATPRDTFILVRGNFQVKGEKVTPGVPAVWPPLPEGAPANRLAFARWLVAPNHPLTARVTVNRYWLMLFGAGLVRTSNDFGSQGEWPSHPELLDWLARDFIESGWDVKRMMKQLVMSAAYRQTGVVSKKLLELDPENRLLARGPRVRLDAELIRDNALAISGLLNPKIGGPSVKPYQPPGLWEQVGAGAGASVFVQTKGPEQYRRGLYVYWKRALAYPSFVTFDAPTRETCVVQRARTATPLQSLVLMNDPVYVEAARAFAQRIFKEGGDGLMDRLTFAMRVAVGRVPTSGELQILGRTYYQQLATFQQDKKAATDLLAVGDFAKPAGVDDCELAAMAAVGNVILNLNETITK